MACAYTTAIIFYSNPFATKSAIRRSSPTHKSIHTYLHTYVQYYIYFGVVRISLLLTVCHKSSDLNGDGRDSFSKMYHLYDYTFARPYRRAYLLLITLSLTEEWKNYKFELGLWLLAAGCLILHKNFSLCTKFGIDSLFCKLVSVEYFLFSTLHL